MKSYTRPRRSRTRTGCLTCRSRKKKCDEVRPRCAGCRRNLLDCTWPAYIAYNDDRTVAMQQLSDPWQSQDGNFIAVQPRTLVPGPVPGPNIHIGSDRACALTPHSIVLLGHFARETVFFFTMAPLQDNPLITLLMPLGYMDDLLMHGLLALGGAHLTHKCPTSAVIASTTRLHYANLIKGLRGEVATLKDDDLERKERLLRVLVITCLYEIVSGDTQGAIFKHLHASRQLILSLLNESSTKTAPINYETMSFSIELYRYLVFSNTITPHGIAIERSLPLDSFLTVTYEPEIKLSPTLGPIFAGTHGLFQLVPMISLLASQKLAEESRGLNSPSPRLTTTRNYLYDRIRSWKIASACQGGDNEREEHINLAAETLRHGLHIYLISALAGSVMSDKADMFAIQNHLRELFGYAHRLVTSRYTAILLWPVTIAGSCVLDSQEQQILLREISSKKYGMKHMDTIGNLLQLLWEDPDPRAFGPYGLHLTMGKHGLSVGLA